jgi:hypothetical protein
MDIAKGCIKYFFLKKLLHLATVRGIFVTERRFGSSFSEGLKPELLSGTFLS